MYNAEKGIIRLQPRQLYEMVMAYRYQYPMCTDETQLDQFGIYTDRLSIKCAVNDFNSLLGRSNEGIEVIFGPIQQRKRNKPYIPYLHDVYACNQKCCETLSLNTIAGDITFHKLLRVPPEPIQQNLDLVFSVLASDEEFGTYDAINSVTDKSKLQLLSIMHIANRTNAGRN